MINKISLVSRFTLAAVLLATATASQAAITVYTSLASFSAAISAAGTDDFTGLSISGQTPSPTTRITNSGVAYKYEVDAGPVDRALYGAGTTANPSLSINRATDTLFLGSFASGIVGVGGNFYGTNNAGAYVRGKIDVTVTDADGTFSQIVSSLSESIDSFYGFVSTTGITSMTVASRNLAGQESDFTWPTVDNLVMGQQGATAPIPEPSTYALMLAGLGALGVIARRRKA